MSARPASSLAYLISTMLYNTEDCEAQNHSIIEQQNKMEDPPVQFEQATSPCSSVKPAIRKQNAAYTSRKKKVSISENDEVRTFHIHKGERMCCIRPMTEHENAKMERDMQNFKLYAMEVHPNSRKYLSLRSGDWRQDNRVVRKRKMDQANDALGLPKQTDKGVSSKRKTQCARRNPAGKEQTESPNPGSSTASTKKHCRQRSRVLEKRRNERANAALARSRETDKDVINKNKKEEANAAKQSPADKEQTKSPNPSTSTALTKKPRQVEHHRLENRMIEEAIAAKQITADKEQTRSPNPGTSTALTKKPWRVEHHRVLENRMIEEANGVNQKTADQEQTRSPNPAASDKQVQMNNDLVFAWNHFAQPNTPAPADSHDADWVLV